MSERASERETMTLTTNEICAYWTDRAPPLGQRRDNATRATFIQK